MSQRTTSLRHRLIINKLRVAPQTWPQIDAFLKQESEIQQYPLAVGQRQFQRDIDSILSLYGIIIENDRSTKQYRIVNPDRIDERYLEAFDVFNLLKVGGNRSKHISYDKRRPQGTEHLYGLLHAINNQYAVSFGYHKFYELDSERRQIAPYALKEVKSRWYVVGWDRDKNDIRVFALDRIISLRIDKRKYTMPTDFDVEQLFHSSFGIILPKDGQAIETVELSFTPFQGKYIKSLPLHGSQQILIDNEQELRVRLHIYITYDFVMELLSLGREVSVVHPSSLAAEVKAAHQAAMQR